jgi:hypothetical protein
VGPPGTVVRHLTNHELCLVRHPCFSTCWPDEFACVVDGVQHDQRLASPAGLGGGPVERRIGVL